MNIVSILNSWKGVLDAGKPFSKQIYLVSASIAGAYFVDGIYDLIEKIKIDTKLRFVCKPDNKYDELAILVKDQNNNKFGYVPREKNPILARLMDTGNNFISFLRCKTCNFNIIFILKCFSQ